MVNNEKKILQECLGIRAMTLKERYQHFREEVNASIEEIRAAETVGGIIKSTCKLETLMNHALQDSQLREVHSYVKDILGTIRSIKMRDCTRKDLIKLLEVTMESCDEAIALENHNEHVNRVRWFFQQCAEHAEDLSDFIDFSKLFGE